MLNYLAGLGVWNWFILGALLLVAEIVAPGTFMIWLGLSAIGVGLISLVVDWPWQLQLVAFAVFSLGSILVWRKLNPVTDEARPDPLLNRRGDALIGRIFTLEKPIIDGSGNIRVDDTVWRISGPDIAAGTRVRVARADGGILVVEPV